MATKKAKTAYPKVTVGTHLTVTEYEDGRTELKWDDDQLLKEVREAIASVTKPKKKAAARTVVSKKVPVKATAKKTVTKKKTK